MRNRNGNSLRRSAINRRRDLTQKDAVWSVRKTEANETATWRASLDGGLFQAQAKGPAGRHGSRLRAELAAKNQRLPLLGDDDDTADRNYIKEFLLARDRELGRKYGVEYAEAFHYIGPATSGPVEDYLRKNAVPLK